MRRSFDHLANSYHFLERLFFGRSLERARAFGLPYARQARRILLIGNGDGRFSHALLRHNQVATVDSIDISAGMLRRARKRSPSYTNRFNAIQADALQYHYPKNNYDVIVLYFVLDCFNDEQAQALLDRLLPSLRKDGRILYADFKSNSFIHARIIALLYAAFGLTTGIAARKLPKIKWPDNLCPIASETFRKGLVFSRVLQKTEDGHSRALNR